MLFTRRRRRGLRLRLFLTFGLLSFGFTLLTASVFFNVERTTLEDQAAAELGERVGFALAAGDREVHSNPQNTGLSAFSWKNAGSGESWQGDSLYPWKVKKVGDYFVFSKSEWFGNSPVSMQMMGTSAKGLWRAEFSMASQARVLQRSASFLLLYLLLNLLIMLGLGAVWLSRWVVRPVTKLADAMTDVRDAASFRPVDVNRWDEIGALTASFNQLMSRLKEAEASNRNYIAKIEEAYQSLERAQEQLVTSEKLSSLGRLSAGIAHEIGNPLSAISGYLSILGRLGPADQQDAADIIQRAANEAARIDRIIRGLLDFARPRADEQDALPLGGVLRNVVDNLAAQLLFKDIDIRLEAGKHLPAVRTGGGRLEQVLVNLCVNAADAMTMAHATVRQLSIEAVQTVRGVEIRVRDTGPGIAPQDLPHLFEPFFSTKLGKGTGLGLAISHQIVTALQGNLTVSSKLGEGALFVIELPAEKVGAASSI